uniref:DDE Tnp4 domain-containing protein n=1 Tax=Sparus aurata TaxID=8175 RepID=A0A671XQ01_SPAAU
MNPGEELCAAAKSSCDAQTQWSDPGMEDHIYSKGPTITCELHTPPPPELQHPVADSILESDADSLLYTGIPLTEFRTLVACLQPFAPASPSMPVVDQILMTLMKLRQNFVMADLARRFKISQGQVNKTVGMWVDIMCEHIKDLIVWLPRETIKATLPKAFKEHFANTTCVIDCTETVLQKPKNLDSRSESYSHYYENNTVKYLVAVSPSGVIMFISDAYGGKCSDRYITQNCGFLDYLRAGDEVMGDRGFTVRDLLEERRVNLIIPTFTRKGCQLTNEGVTRTRRIAHARIHVERAIRRLKVYKILSQTVPINLVPKIDKILKICAGLVNLRSELISSEH